MTSNTLPVPAPSEVKAKPFPRYCPRCRKREVRPTIIAHQSQVLHDDELHTIEVPRLEVPQCGNCGEFVFDLYADDQISEALRAKLHLLTPEQIRANREALGLSPRELAALLGVAEEMVSDWEDSLRIQSRVEDNFLRVYFAAPEVRTLLASFRHDPSLGASVVPATMREPQPQLATAASNALVPETASPR